MCRFTREFTFASPEETAAFAHALGAALHPGDCLLLSGDIGAGKTHFARALIQSLMPAIEDVPSPTFTLVQTYDTVAGEIWHADLYRLNMVDEVFELGLVDAFETAITLIEWPDRLGDLAPKTALELHFRMQAEHEGTRTLSCGWEDQKWVQVMKEIGA